MNKFTEAQLEKAFTELLGKEHFLKVGLILLLDEFNYPPVERDEVYGEIFDQAENFKKNQIRA